MHQPSKWWTGLFPVAALWIAAGFFGAPDVERDLSKRVTGALASAAPDVARALTVAAAGRDVIVTGPEFFEGLAGQTAAAASDVSGVRIARVNLAPVPVAKPYEFSAVRSGGKFTLSGGAPLPGQREKLLEAASAAAAGQDVVDTLTYAAGAPDGFEAMAARGIIDAARLDGGAFKLTDRAWSIAGTAATSEIFEAAIAATQNLPAGATLAKADIQPPESKPYAWTVNSDGVAATLSGVAPSLEARAAIARAASASLPGKMIVNQMRIARGAPRGDFVEAATWGLTELGRLGKGKVSISDGAYTIVGEASTAEIYEAAMAAVKTPPDGLTVARVDIQPPELKPFVWKALFDGKLLTLSGGAASPALRDAIAAEAARLFPGVSIVNEMTIARGAPDGDSAKAAGAALAALAGLKDGQATSTDSRLALIGQGSAEAVDGRIATAAKAALPEPFTLANVDIKEAAISPYTFKLERADGKVKLSGYAPDEKSRADLVAAAKSTFFNDSVEDGLKLGKGAPANFTDGVKSLFGPIAGLADGALSISDGAAAVDGRAIYGKAADRIKAALAKAAPAGFKLATPAIGVKPPGAPLPAAACQPAFASLLGKARILFDTGSARLSEESTNLLDYLVEVAQRCRDVDVEISGHTDSVGSAEANLELSRRRAEAVLSYLSESGMDTSRLKAVGYGEEKPVASNDTPEGREQNRRIEFVVK